MVNLLLPGPLKQNLTVGICFSDEFNEEIWKQRKNNRIEVKLLETKQSQMLVIPTGNPSQNFESLPNFCFMKTFFHAVSFPFLTPLWFGTLRIDAQSTTPLSILLFACSALLTLVAMLNCVTRQLTPLILSLC